MTEYSFTTAVPVRYQDRDAMGHVNNAIYATYLEEARIDYFEEVLDAPLHEVSVVLASLELAFHRPVERADEVTVGVCVPEVGESSIPMEYEVRIGGEGGTEDESGTGDESGTEGEDGTDSDVVATGESVQVVVDEATKSSKSVPESWRTAINEFEGL